MNLSLKQSINRRYFIVVAILLFIVIGLTLLVFSINTDGKLIFLVTLQSTQSQAFLTIGLGCIAAIIVAIALNISGEAAQSTSRNALASPFTLGLTSVMSLAYALSSFFNHLSITYVALISFALMLCLNIIPIYFLSISKYQKNNNIFIFYGLSISILINSSVSLITFFSQPIDFNILGWLTTGYVHFSNEKFIVGSIFFIIGFLIFILIAKKIHILENNYFKASSMSVNVALTNVISLVAISLMAIAGFIVYAPLTLLGFAIPFITKRYLIKQYDIRLSILPSSLLSILITLLAYVIHIYLHTDINVMIVLIMSPLIVFMMLKKDVISCAR